MEDETPLSVERLKKLVNLFDAIAGLSFTPNVIEVLITLVKERRAIWDMYNQEYKDKKAKVQHWKDITDLLGLPKQSLIGVKRKWEMLCFTKNHSPYAEKLSFLNPLEAACTNLNLEVKPETLEFIVEYTSNDQFDYRSDEDLESNQSDEETNSDTEESKSETEDSKIDIKPPTKVNEGGRAVRGRPKANEIVPNRATQNNKRKHTSPVHGMKLRKRASATIEQSPAKILPKNVEKEKKNRTSKKSVAELTGELVTQELIDVPDYLQRSIRRDIIQVLDRSLGREACVLC